MKTKSDMIPKLDWRRYSDGADREGFVRDLAAALRGPGLLRLSRHGISPALIVAAFDASRAVFNLTEAEKRTLLMPPGSANRGWTPLGAERLADATGQMERREAFNIGLDLPLADPRVVQHKPFRSVNRWPDIPGFRQTMLEYYDATLALGLRLHECIARDLGLPEDHFKPVFEDPLATLRLVTYPPGTGREGEIGAGAHTDYGSISLLLTDEEPGLQARLRSGEWVDIAPDGDSFVLLVGDTLQGWSNGTYAATPHRVLPPHRRRHALVFYVDPAPQVPVAPLPELGGAEVRTMSYEQYLAERLAATQGMMRG